MRLTQRAPFREPWESGKVVSDRWVAGGSPAFFHDFQVDSLVFATIQETAIVVRIVQADYSRSVDAASHEVPITPWLLNRHVHVHDPGSAGARGDFADRHQPCVSSPPFLDSDPIPGVTCPTPAVDVRRIGR